MPNITVCSKLPMPLIIGNQDGKDIILKGANASEFRDIRGSVLAGAVGMTEVDSELFDNWMNTIGNTLKCVKSGLIFAQKDRKSAHAEMREKEKLMSGLQGLDQDMNDSRLPQGKNKIEKDKDVMKEPA